MHPMIILIQIYIQFLSIYNFFFSNHFVTCCQVHFQNLNFIQILAKMQNLFFSKTSLFMTLYIFSPLHLVTIGKKYIR